MSGAACLMASVERESCRTERVARQGWRLLGRLPNQLPYTLAPFSLFLRSSLCPSRRRLSTHCRTQPLPRSGSEPSRLAGPSLLLFSCSFLERRRSSERRKKIAGKMKACARAAGERLPLVRPNTRQPLLGKSFVKVSGLSFQHETNSVVACSIKASGNILSTLAARAEHILPATKDCVTKAIDAINEGQVIAVPTDTIYGFACDACSAEAVNRIYEIKGRIQTRPLAICVADVPDISRFAVVDHLPHGLLESLLPGPVTVVLKRGENSILERSLNPGLDSIGVRVPDLDFIRAIARGAGSALALTSANLSGRPSSVGVNDFEDLWPHCSYVFDGGILPSGRAGSTIVDLVAAGVYKILRDGSSREETVAVLSKFGFVEIS